MIVTDHETTVQSIQLRDYLSSLGTQIEYASSSESNGQIEKTHATIIEIYNTNKDKFREKNTKSIIRTSVAFYNNSIHPATKFTPNEIMFNSNNLQNREQINDQANRLFGEVKKNLTNTIQVQELLNLKRKDPPLME